MPPSAIGRLKPYELVRFTRPFQGRSLYVTSSPMMIARVLGGKYPIRTLAVANIEAPDSDGLPLEAEAHALNEAEDQLLGMAAGLTMALFCVGRITYAGQRVLVFHSVIPNPLGPGTGQSLQIQGGDYLWNVYYERDPEYQMIRAVLQPTGPEFHAARNAVLLDDLESKNDRPERTRPITCYGVFPTDKDVVGAIALLSDNHFTCASPEMQPDRSWSVEATYECDTQPDSIEALTQYLMYVCAQCRGEFVGWTCDPVVK